MTVGEDEKDSVKNWAGMGHSYSQSFAHLCAGAIVPLMDTTEAVVGPLGGRRLADVGCGTGNLTALAMDRDTEGTAVDPDAEMLSLACAAAPQAQLLLGAVPNLPLAHHHRPWQTPSRHVDAPSSRLPVHRIRPSTTSTRRREVSRHSSSPAPWITRAAVLRSRVARRNGLVTSEGTVEHDC